LGAVNCESHEPKILSPVLTDLLTGFFALSHTRKGNKAEIEFDQMQQEQTEQVQIIKPQILDSKNVPYVDPTSRPFKQHPFRLRSENSPQRPHPILSRRINSLYQALSESVLQLDFGIRGDVSALCQYEYGDLSSCPVFCQYGLLT